MTIYSRENSSRDSSIDQGKRQHKQPECVTKQPATLRSSKERTSFPYEGDIRFCRPRLCGGKILKSSGEAFRRAGEVDPEPLFISLQYGDGLLPEHREEEDVRDAMRQVPEEAVDVRDDERSDRPGVHVSHEEPYVHEPSV